MRFILQVRSGEQLGNKVLLVPGNQLTVGRTHWADLSCPDDARMSGIHFLVQVEAQGCLVRDLDSTNGTRLNGQFVKEGALSHGDVIVAGATEFLVEMENWDGDPLTTSRLGRMQAQAVEKAGASPLPVVPRGMTVMPGEPGQRAKKSVVLDHLRTVANVDAQYTLLPTGCGWVSCQGGVFGEARSPGNPHEIVNLLTARFPLTLIVDLQRLGMPVPPHRACRPLLALGESTNPPVGPQILCADPSPPVDELINAAWDNDALISLYSNADDQQIADHLQGLANEDVRGRPRSSSSVSVVGFYLPSILSLLLHAPSSRFIERLIEPIQAVLVESAELPQSWRLFIRPELLPQIEYLGLFRCERG